MEGSDLSAFLEVVSVDDEGKTGDFRVGGVGVESVRGEQEE